MKMLLLQGVVFEKFGIFHCFNSSFILLDAAIFHYHLNNFWGYLSNDEGLKKYKTKSDEILRIKGYFHYEELMLKKVMSR